MIDPERFRLMLEVIGRMLLPGNWWEQQLMFLN
jgi:hypothetical protein